MRSDWEDIELGEIFNVKHGFAFKGQYFSDSPTNNYLLTPGNFSTAGGFQDTKPKYYDGPIPEDYVLKPSQIVVTMTDLSKESDTLGYAAVIPDDGKKWLHNQRTGLLEFKKGKLSNPLFISYLLRKHEYRSWIVGSATGTTVKHTSPKRIHSFKCKLPPLPEQKAISHILGSLDDKIELNRQMNETLEAMAQVLFKSWFVDFDPVIDNALAAGNAIPDAFVERAEQRKQIQKTPKAEETNQLFPDAFEFTEEMGWIPLGWDVKTCQELSEKIAMGPFGSNIKVSTFVDSGVPIINGQQLNNTLLTESDNKFISKEHALKIKNSIAYRGDLVFTHRGNIGQVSLIPNVTEYEEFIVSQSQLLLRPNKSKILGSYLIYFFRSHIGQYKLLSNASQVGVPSISRASTHLKSISVVVPHLELVKAFDGQCSTFFDSLVSNRNKIKTLSKLRDTLLPKLLSGELRIPDAEKLVEEAQI